MIIESEKFHSSTGDVYEIAIVGGGTVGLLIAVYLARKGKRVIVLESGGAGPEESSQRLNEAIVVGHPHSGIIQGRARTLGGTSTLWGGQLTKFTRSDFRSRPGILNSDWPITYEEIEKYYQEVGDILNLDKSLDRDTEVFKKAGIPDSFNHSAMEIFLTRWLKETNIARIFKKDIETLSNLQIVLHAQVVDFNFQDYFKKINGVIFSQSDGKKNVIPVKSVVIASGTIETSRTLLNIAALHDDTPWAKNSWLGRCFQDHLDYRAGNVRILNEKNFDRLFQNIVLSGHKYQPKIRFRHQEILQRKILNISCSFSYQSSVSTHLTYLKTLIKSVRNGVTNAPLAKLPSALYSVAKIWQPIVRSYLKNNRIYNHKDLGVTLILHCEQSPLRHSRISLDDVRKDRFGVPLAKLDWQIDKPMQLKSMHEFATNLQKFLLDRDIADVNLTKDLLEMKESLLVDCTDSYHQCGGTQMGTSPDNGVVDENMKVFGTGNLYIAGASTFPSSSYANPTYTAMALGVRLAEHLNKKC